MKFTAKKNYFALLFSDRSIYVAQSGGGKLRFFSKKDLPVGVIDRGEIKNPASLQAAVVELLKLNRVKNRFVVVGLPEVKSFTRTFSLPVLSVEELADAVKWESEPLLPFTLEEAYLDWMVLEKGTNQTRVLVMALPKAFVEGYAQLLESIGLQPVAFEITSLSLARIVSDNKRAQIFLNVEETEAVLVVIGPGGGIEVSSTVSFGSPQEIPGETVAAVKRAITFYHKKVGFDPQAVKVSQDDPRLGVSEKDSKAISQIILMGRSVSPGLVETLKKEAGVQTEILKTIKPDLAVLTSLANKEVASPTDEYTINLIPPRIQGIYDREFRLGELARWMRISLGCLFLILFFYGVVLAQMLFQADKVEKETIELTASESPEYQTTEKEALFLNDRAQKVTALADRLPDKLSLFSFLLEHSSTEVRLDRIIYDGESNSFLVSGFAVDRRSLLQFKEKLEENEKIGRVQIPLSSLEKEENVDFTVSVTGN